MHLKIMMGNAQHNNIENFVKIRRISDDLLTL